MNIDASTGAIECTSEADVASLESLFNSACSNLTDVAKSPVYLLWCVCTSLTASEIQSIESRVAFTRRAALAIADFWRKKCQSQN